MIIKCNFKLHSPKWLLNQKKLFANEVSTYTYVLTTFDPTVAQNLLWKFSNLSIPLDCVLTIFDPTHIGFD